jgi:hypothetical protein
MAERLLFEEHVESQRLAEADLMDIVRLRAPGSEVTTTDVRLKGAMLLHSILENPSAGPAVVLTSTAQDFGGYAVPKLGATHPMSPVGPYEGPGGQHGPLRWLMYHEVPNSQGEWDPYALNLLASERGWPIIAQRTVRMESPSKLVLGTELKNMTQATVGTSIGEHAYFAMPVAPQSASDLRVNGLSLDHEQIGGGGAFEKVMGGKALLWPGFNGKTDITFPDGRVIRIGARQYGSRKEQKVDMLIWHRPGTDTICFEPAVGLRPDESGKSVGSNRGSVLLGSQSVRLETTIELL